jgi:tRNA modification GTPase
MLAQDKGRVFACNTTGPGTCAIAVTEVIGPGSLKIVNSIFQGRPIKIPDRLYHGWILKGTQRLDEVIVRYVSAEASFTGLPTVEICGHGGRIPVQALLELLKEKGCEVISQDELIRLAFGNRKIDRIQAEAYSLLRYALTPLCARVLIDQAQGVLSRAIQDIIDGHSPVEGLLKTANFGIALVKPPRVVIAGVPNVGKSTLFNTLVQRDRVLVHETPGTTRDPVHEYIAINGIPFELVDTAGFREGGSELDALCTQMSLQEIQKSRLVIWVSDVTQTPLLTVPVFDEKIVLPVVNKIDLGICKDTPASWIHISALKEIGIDRLRGELLKRAGLEFEYTRPLPVIFTQRQYEGLKLLMDTRDQGRLKEVKDSILWGPIL